MKHMAHTHTDRGLIHVPSVKGVQVLKKKKIPGFHVMKVYITRLQFTLTTSSATEFSYLQLLRNRTLSN